LKISHITSKCICFVSWSTFGWCVKNKVPWNCVDFLYEQVMYGLYIMLLNTYKEINVSHAKLNRGEQSNDDEFE
jgi:hypothetical protein